MNFLIMHGSYGSPEENWFRWLERQLKENGHKVILEQFPVDDWDVVNKIGVSDIVQYQPVQTLSAWDEYFASHVLPRLQAEPKVFVGHSIAPIFMLHMLQKYDFKLAGAVFVAPFFNIPDGPKVWQFFPVNHTFYSYDFDFTKIQSQLGKSYVVYGDDDPYVRSTEPPLFAEKLGSEIHVVPGGGHCGGIFKEFPLVRDLALSLA
jgi:predicted alpha/beta hydrolase family esterase